MRRPQESGQTLVMLLAFMTTALIITMSAATVTVISIQTASKYSLGEEVLHIAESGMDNALLRLERDPSYTGETLTLSGGTATITISGSPSAYTIVSKGTMGIYQRTIQVSAARLNNIVVVSSWSETP